MMIKVLYNILWVTFEGTPVMILNYRCTFTDLLYLFFHSSIMDALEYVRDYFHDVYAQVGIQKASRLSVDMSFIMCQISNCKYFK
jgi:hypothetical protein